ncbi:4'-phosphopantetheinyl transferase family protein [Streptomyces sp. NPDC048751]|uniref:4'-phosphopantetheinyl transferase family protein n=1 Tax=Streptomyces sp. NPDC048751 TaxID=3365591 RepID=UPI00371DDDEB
MVPELSGRGTGRWPRPLELSFDEAPEFGRASPRAAPDTDGLSLWLVDALSQGEHAARIAPGLLDAAEHRRAAAFGRPGDRRRYVVAHVAVRVLLGARLGVPGDVVRLVREPCPSCGAPHGRPVVLGADAHFSISRSGDVVLVGIADRPVGVDVEQVPPPEVVAELSPFLHRREAAELAAEADHRKASAFARAWARKEAYLKGIGTGLSRDPARDYVGAGPSPGTGPHGWVLGDVAVPEGHAGACALRADRAATDDPARRG